MNKTFTVSLRKPGHSGILFMDKSYDECMALAHAMEAFPDDVVSVEVYNSETMETAYKWESPEWKED